MKVAFDTLPGTSKVWIYQSSRRFTQEEEDRIQTAAEEFVDSWTAHQAGLKAGVKIMYHHFLIIAVDESYNNASGCSIDKQVHFVQSQGSKFNIDFFNRMNIVCKLSGSEFLLTPVSNIEKLLHDGSISSDTITFNNLVDNLRDFSTGWEVKISDSWIANFIDRKEA